jgi:hypothetical protein
MTLMESKYAGGALEGAPRAGQKAPRVKGEQENRDAGRLPPKR